jgi:putative nucleotidyltransferase with HDIG domain
MGITVEELIEQAGKLPPFPQAATKTLELIRNPESNVAEVVSALSVDQVLSGIVLRWANSAYYGSGMRVATVHQAVMLLGLYMVYELILSASMANYLNRPVPGYDLKRGELWRHSLGVAFGARILAQNRGWKNAEEAYFAGLLSDIGKIALESLLRDVDMDRPEMADRSFETLEQALFGFDHAELGSEMARRWNFPEPLIAAIRYHHNPAEAGEYAPLAAAVHVADAAMMMMGVGVGKDGLRYMLDERATQALALTDKELFQLIEKMSSQIRMAELFIGVDGNA